MSKLPFYFGQMTVPNGLIAFCLLCSGFFSGTPQTSKYFKLPPFWLLDSAYGLREWLKQKAPFSGKMNHHTIACSTYKADTAEHISSHHFSFSPSHLSCYLHPRCIASTLRSMAEGPAHNPTIANPPADEGTRSDSEAESTAKTTSSSPTHGASMMAKGEIPELTDFFKKTNVSEEELQTYHSCDRLTGNVLSSIPEVDVPTVHGSSVLSFESHLLAGLGLPPSKFLSAIMNYLGCSLVHFNANAIATLSSFVMLCECCLGIPPDSSLFWYYYSPS
jgi:hypothetical protein